MNDIPKVGRACVTVNPGPNYTVELREDYPVPVPKRGELLLRLNMTGLCLSDIHGMKCDLGAPMTCQTSGHEGAGVVVALGEGVEDWQVGDRGGVKPIWDTCHQCSFCREGMETHCAKIKPTGVVVDGSYSQYIITPARYTSRIPDGVEDKYAAPLMCSGATIYTALKNSGARAGQWVVVPGGGGGVGHMALTFGKALGLRVLAIDTSEEKRKMCLELGAEAFIDFKTCEDVTAEVHNITGGGAHAVIVTGGTAGAYASAPPMLRTGGTMIAIGLPAAGTAMAGADPVMLIFKKLKIAGSLTGNMRDVHEALDFVRRGLVKPVVTVLPFSKFKEGLEQLAASKVAGRLVVDFNA